MKVSGLISVTVPGSLMLLGEHAVLHGQRALVCAINRYMHLHLTPRPDTSIHIQSALGHYEAPLHALVDHPSFRFLLEGIRQHAHELSCGFDLEVESDFPADIGFGSSAAVTVALQAALLQLIYGEPPHPTRVFQLSLDCVHAVQGRGSGADLAASVFGGAVSYGMHQEMRSIAMTLPLTAVYCGYKTPTPEVIQKVEAQRSEFPDLFSNIYEEMGRSAAEAVEALESRDLPFLGEILNRNQVLMDQIGVNTPELQAIVDALQSSPGIFGAKISGSGMGDCAVGIGRTELNKLEVPVYHLEMEPDGYRFAKRHKES